MLIGDSYPKYLFIRGAIFALRLIAPASILYCIVLPSVRPRLFLNHPLPLPFSIWAIAESSFFLLGYLPLKYGLQREAVHPEPPSQHERQTLFKRCLDTLTEPEFYFSRWFLGASLAEIKRDNVKEFYAWSFMNKTFENTSEAEDAELDRYVEEVEEKFDLDFEPGVGKARSLRGTIEGVHMQHRPLVWYLTIGIVDVMSSMQLLMSGYRFHRESLWTIIAMLPFRPLSLFGSASQPMPKISYWYREHTAKNRLPIVFFHGVGVGMYAYASFLIELSRNLTSADGNGTVGLLVVENLPISARICNPALVADEMRQELKTILQKHGWEDFVLVGHSYGSAIAASIIRDPDFFGRVKAAVLMDPICFLLHLPDVAYNFTRRKPSKASEYMLYYFSSQDMMISHTLARRFFWSQYILWKEDLGRLPVTVTLSGRDIIVPTKSVWNYLTNSSPGDHDPSLPIADHSGSSEEDNRIWSSGRLNVLWFDKYNHADLFDSKRTIQSMVQRIQTYSTKYGGRSS